MIKILKIKLIILIILSIIGCANNPRVNVFSTEMNSKEQKNLIKKNNNGDEFIYEKNKKNEIIKINKISTGYTYEECKKNLIKDIEELSLNIFKDSSMILNGFKDKDYYENKGLKFSKINCKENESKYNFDLKEERYLQPIYYYEIKVENIKGYAIKKIYQQVMVGFVLSSVFIVLFISDPLFWMDELYE